MFSIADIPKRQQILMIITLSIGAFFLLLSFFTRIPSILIFIYSFCIPTLLLCFDFIIDLNNKETFKAWYAISIVIFLVRLLGYNNEQFRISRSASFNNNGINSYITCYSVTSLKGLFIFLSTYWIINRLYNKRGLFIINTFRQSRWYHDGVRRKITVLDFWINVILFLSIILSCLF